MQKLISSCGFRATAAAVYFLIVLLTFGVFRAVIHLSSSSNNKEYILKYNDSCENEEAVIPLLNKTNDFQILGCGGLVNLALRGSVFLKYKFCGDPGEEQRCLWTIHSTHNNTLYINNLKISLLCDKLSLNDSLTISEWNPLYNSDISWFDLRSNNTQLHYKHSFRQFLYFNSKRVSTKTEFIVQVDILKVYSYFTELNWSFNTVPGRVNYDQFKEGQSYSIAIATPKTRAVQFTVEQVHSDERCGVGLNYFDRRDGLDVYELGERGKPRLLRRLCANITSPVSYSTQHPIIAVFYAYSGSVGTFRVSWK